LIHNESDAISAPAYLKQADMAAGKLSGAFDAFSEIPGSHRPYANLHYQRTARWCSHEAGDKGAATP
jgi:hypothetical protein